MSATIESDESNQVDVINITSCVTLFYEKGKSESAFLRKEKLLLYALVDIVICFFDTDLSLLKHFPVIEVKRKEVVIVTSVRYSCQKFENFSNKRCHRFGAKRWTYA